jgi:hypothetical protein
MARRIADELCLPTRGDEARQASQVEEEHVDVRIGVTQTPKELEVVLSDDANPDKVRAHIDSVVAAGGTLWLTDRRGRQIGVPVEKLAYVEIGSPETSRRVGFGG